MSTQLLVEALGRDPQFHMIESASNGPAILNLMKREKAQIAVISTRLGEDNGGGYDLIREIRSAVAQYSGDCADRCLRARPR